jgi:hypothetical protein
MPDGLGEGGLVGEPRDERASPRRGNCDFGNVNHCWRIIVVHGLVHDEVLRDPRCDRLAALERLNVLVQPLFICHPPLDLAFELPPGEGANGASGVARAKPGQRVGETSPCRPFALQRPRELGGGRLVPGQALQRLVEPLLEPRPP